MKRAFTLLELMTVIAIMASLSVVAIGGYRSATKGMKDRGALTVAQTFLDQVRQRAVIDRETISVYFYDDLMQKEDEANNRELIGSGVAIAVKGMGRVSGIDGKYIMDEFNDLNVGEDELDEEDEDEEDVADYDKSAMRIYRMADGKAVDISPKVEILTRSEVFLLTGQETGDQSTQSTPSSTNEKKLYIPAYLAIGENPFNRGDVYGSEFAAIRLPNGYFFGSSVPTTEGRSSSPIQRLDIKPDGTGSKNIKIYTFKSLGSTQLEDVGSTAVIN